MRKKETNGITIEYPDEIAFCFNPVIINIYGGGITRATVIVSDPKAENTYEESREIFKQTVFFDVSAYMQGAFGSVNENRIDYDTTSDSGMGRKFSIDVDLYNENSMVDSIQFDTFVMWGAMRIGERYNGNRKMTWFKNYPFTVGLYAGASGSAQVEADGVPGNAIQLSGQGVWNLSMNAISANQKVVFNLPASGKTASVFDHTFDFTFKGLLNTPTRIECVVDDSECGVYLRWINRHGMYCYWLFAAGDETRQVINDGEFLRNNMQDYSYTDGYHGGTGRKQRKTENDTLPICAPLVDQSTYDFLFELATSPVVDLFAGYQDGKPQWKGVNVSVDNFVKTSSPLQDFICTVILPELNLQSL